MYYPNNDFRNYLNNDLDYIEHSHKYLRKEMKNGKWRYYYDQVSNKSSRFKQKAKDKIIDVKYDIENIPSDIKSGVRDIKDNIDNKLGKDAREDYLRSERSLYNSKKTRDETYFNNPKTEGEKSWNRVQDDFVKTKEKELYDAKIIYSKTPMGKIESVIEKGKKLLDKYFYKKIGGD